VNETEFLAWAATHSPWSELPVQTIPDEWRDALEEVWNEHYDFIDNVGQSISKKGNIWVPVATMREYAARLTVPEQVKFYLSLRRAYPWRDSEFRPDFERGFPDCVAHLPPALTVQECELAWVEVVRRAEPGPTF
jgi:hypothetical protein